jgi:hypothetical protein
VSHIIATLVVTIIIELNTKAPVWTFVQTGKKTFHNHPRTQLEVVETGEDGRVEKI